MTAVVIVALAALLGLVYAARPLFGPRAERPDTARSDALHRKAAALQAILDLDSDLAAGKLEREDHEVFKAMYERDALNAMRELDVAAQSAHDTELEAEIAAARADLR